MRVALALVFAHAFPQSVQSQKSTLRRHALLNQLACSNHPSATDPAPTMDVRWYALLPPASELVLNGAHPVQGVWAPHVINAQLRGRLRIGVHRDVDVTDAPKPGRLVSQAFCSALPVANSNLSALEWANFAQIV